MLTAYIVAREVLVACVAPPAGEMVMERQHQIDFLDKAEERFQARWAKKLSNPAFVEKLRKYDSEVVAQPASALRYA